jgi:hypothetical protein
MSNAFKPERAATVNIDVSLSSQSVKVHDERGPFSVRIMNNGTATAWINFGDSAVTADLASGMPVGPGAREVVTFDNPGNGALYVAAIAAASTGKIYFTPGRGI